MSTLSRNSVSAVAVNCEQSKPFDKNYDRDIAAVLMSDDRDWKIRIASEIDRLCESEDDLPVKVHENRKLLARQIARLSRPNEA